MLIKTKVVIIEDRDNRLDFIINKKNSKHLKMKCSVLCFDVT